MRNITADDIRAFLTELGRRYPRPAMIYLLGGSAICLLGSARQTIDIDYAADFSSPLEVMVVKALPQARAYDINPREFREHWETLKKMTKH